MSDPMNERPAGDPAPGKRDEGATVWIPSLLRDLTQGREILRVAGGNVRQVIQALDERYPGIKDRLCLGGRLRPGIAVAVDGQLAPLGLLQAVGPNSEVHFLPAVSGG